MTCFPSIATLYFQFILSHSDSIVSQECFSYIIKLPSKDKESWSNLPYSLSLTANVLASTYLEHFQRSLNHITYMCMSLPKFIYCFRIIVSIHQSFKLSCLFHTSWSNFETIPHTCPRIPLFLTDHEPHELPQIDKF